MTFSWFAAKTKPQREEQAFASLVEQGFAAFLPRAHDVRTHHRSKKQIDSLRPRYPGYVFVGLRPGAHHFGFASRCDGMGRFVGFNGRPAPLPAAFIDTMAEAQFLGDFSALMRDRRNRAAMRKGDLVKVVDGVFASRGGVVSKIIKSRQKAIIEFEGLLGMMSEVEIDIGHLRAA